RWITTTVALLVLSVPFFYWPPESMYIREHEKALHRKVPLSTLYHSSGNRPPAVELRRGKHIIAYLSLSCRFCRKAARRLSIMYEKHPEIPFYFILNGNPDMLDSFLKETHSASVPHSLFNGAHQFMTLNNGYSLPTIQWMEDSIQVRQSNYITLSEGEIMEWLKH
ncbi:MAG TPA: hypothetical protein PLP34_06380, partial [Chitinophagaceae bacterium]|nr:hypothetical protein [Chitinophagaceae bacterium]